MADFRRWKRKVKETVLVNSLLATTLSPEAIEAACRAFGHAWRETFWNPTTTKCLVLDIGLHSATTTMSPSLALMQAGLCAVIRDFCLW